MNTDWSIIFYLPLPLICIILVYIIGEKDQKVYGRELDMLNLLIIMSEDDEWQKQEDIFQKFKERGYKQHGNRTLIFALMSLEHNYILQRDDRVLVDRRRVVGRDPTCPRFRIGCDEFVQRALKEPKKYLICWGD